MTEALTRGAFDDVVKPFDPVYLFRVLQVATAMRGDDRNLLHTPQEARAFSTLITCSVERLDAA